MTAPSPWRSWARLFGSGDREARIAKSRGKSRWEVSTGRLGEKTWREDLARGLGEKPWRIARAVLILAASFNQRQARPAMDFSLHDESTTVAGGFQPVELVEGSLAAGVVILCDHASNALPGIYGDLGLPPGALARHIAYDVGAAWLTRRLANLLNAPAVLSTFSRLLIDPNRGADDPTLVMRLSDGAIVPGNAGLDEAEIARRRDRYWQPYREACGRTVEAMSATGREPAALSIHSFTPYWRGRPRPWKIGVLWDKDPRLPAPLLRALAEENDLQPADELIGDNEPYDGALAGDTIDSVATARGLANALIEIRQDLIATKEDAEAWAARLARLIAPILDLPHMHERIDFGSRAPEKSRPRE
jgi:predicted N-formylglutamate amidohydrolase